MKNTPFIHTARSTPPFRKFALDCLLSLAVVALYIESLTRTNR